MTPTAALRDATPPIQTEARVRPAAYPVLGVPIHDADADGILAVVAESLTHGRRCHILYANAHQLNLAAEDPSLLACLRDADLVICDGFGAALAVYALHRAWPSRQTPPDWVDALASLAARRSRSLFLLGSEEASCRGTADVLLGRHPGLRIAGLQDGYFDRTPGSAGNRRVVDAINAAGTDILLVGFGSPLQESWIRENAPALDCRVIIAVGAMFDYVSGRHYRAPRWVTNSGLEWASRLVSDPRRLWRRYLLGLPAFAFRVATRGRHAVPHHPARAPR